MRRKARNSHQEVSNEVDARAGSMEQIRFSEDTSSSKQHVSILQFLVAVELVPIWLSERNYIAPRETSFILCRYVHVNEFLTKRRKTKSKARTLIKRSMPRLIKQHFLSPFAVKKWSRTTTATTLHKGKENYCSIVNNSAEMFNLFCNAEADDVRTGTRSSLSGMNESSEWASQSVSVLSITLSLSGNYLHIVSTPSTNEASHQELPSSNKVLTPCSWSTSFCFLLKTFWVRLRVWLAAGRYRYSLVLAIFESAALARYAPLFWFVTEVDTPPWFFIYVAVIASTIRPDDLYRTKVGGRNHVPVG